VRFIRLWRSQNTVWVLPVHRAQCDTVHIEQCVRVFRARIIRLDIAR